MQPILPPCDVRVALITYPDFPAILFLLRRLPRSPAFHPPLPPSLYSLRNSPGVPPQHFALKNTNSPRAITSCPSLLQLSTIHPAPQVVLNVSNGVYAQRAVDRAAAARAARVAAASASPSADSTPHHTPLPLPPVDMFSDAPLPAFVGPARGGGGVASVYDDAPAAAAASPTGAAAAAMPPPRPVSKQKDAKFIGFGGISAAYDDVYVAAHKLCRV